MSYRQKVPVEQRFWAKVNRRIPDDCWIWQGKPDRKGYGRFGYEHQIVFAHRFSYELAYGPIPEGMYVCHKCDVPACVNPSHFFLGTLADNNRDMFAKGRGHNPPLTPNAGRFTSERMRGENHHKAKLTWEDVDEAKQLRSQGWKWKDIAARYGVALQSVENAVKGKTWKEAKR